MRDNTPEGDVGVTRRARRRFRKRQAAKRTVLRYLPWVLVAVGLAIAAFAVISRLSVSSEQKRFVVQYRNTEQSTAVSAAPPGQPGPTGELPDPDTAQPEESGETDAALLAVLTIPSIDLEVAMREGVGSRSLRYTVGHYPRSVMPGETGNCVIMGHRKYTYGEFFNRLDELEAGDELILERAGTVYTYTVTEKFVVAPSDTYVLDPTEDATITLITCTPIRVATHRLIVRGVLQSTRAAE